MKASLFALLFFTCSILFAQSPSDTVRVFFLGGQSNMDGYGYTKDLPKELRKNIDDVYIFHATSLPDNVPVGGLGKWEILKPGHGADFKFDGQSNQRSDRFGLELSFAQRLKELYPNDKIALIKYAKGGSSIDSMANKYGCWEPDFSGINQYEHALSTINNAFSNTDIDKDGKEDYLIPCGILWMQGESDAYVSEAIALRYQTNLKRLMDLLRASLRNNSLPVVVGKISDSWNHTSGKVWPYGELVQYAQEKYVKNDNNAAIVRDTRYYKYSDPYHYNSEGYIHLGKRFADEIYQLNQTK